MSEKQEKIYAMLERLQQMTTEIPLMLQQRLPNELLSSLASALVEGEIFKIVHLLTEVQQATEKQLFKQRTILKKQMDDEKRAFDTRYQETICSAASDEEVLILSTRLDREKQELLLNHKDKLRQFDESVIEQIDQKVYEQQSTLEEAGVPGFKVTQNPREIQVQMHLVDFITRLNPEQAQT